MPGFYGHDRSKSSFRVAEIFLSYNREDQTVARRYAEAFERNGLTVWWDTTLRVGEVYDEVTEAALRNARAVVVLWSPRSVVSRWVRAEATLADRANTLVPVMIEACERPIMFELTQTAELSHWQGEADDRAWLALLEEVRRFVGGARSATAAPRAAPVAVVPRENLLAVLAFDNLSNDEDMRYFSDGVSEEILYTVARAKGLRVCGKASSFQFRGAEKSTQKVAEALGATHMLDGSVRRAGNNIRINVELVDTATLLTLWSERYDRALTDIFALQDEIAGEIAAALQLHFAPARVAVSVDPVAYDLYLQARAIYAQDLTFADQRKCVALLESAVARSPDFAPAWGLLGLYRHGEPAIIAARRGLAIDPDCATSLAALALNMQGSPSHAERLATIERAYRLSPDDQLVCGVYTVLLISVGWLQEALDIAVLRQERDPLSAMVAGGRAMVLRSAGRHAEAIAIADRALRDFPDSGYVRFIRCVLAIYDGDIDLAASLAASAPNDGAVAPLQVLCMFMRAVTAMDPAMRAATVQQFLRRAMPRCSLVDLGIAASLGEVDLALEELLAAIRESRPVEFAAESDGRSAGNDQAPTSALFMPNGEVMRRDVRFAEICVRLGLYDCWRSTGRWPDCIAALQPHYDLKAECEKIAGTVPPYVIAAKS